MSKWECLEAEDISRGECCYFTLETITGAGFGPTHSRILAKLSTLSMCLPLSRFLLFSVSNRLVCGKSDTCRCGKSVLSAFLAS